MINYNQYYLDILRQDNLSQIEEQALYNELVSIENNKLKEKQENANTKETS
jgi:hypothetical protein